MKQSIDSIKEDLAKKDFANSWFSGTGAGDQHRNQKANLKEAFKAAITSGAFKVWMAITTDNPTHVDD